MSDSTTRASVISPMNSGDGEYSYAKNSSFQSHAANFVKEKIDQAIAEKIDMKNLCSSKRIHIADFGCSVGPNTIIAMQNILESVKRKYKSQFPSCQMPEFQVFFNDQASNDFNTLFASLPPEREYFAAGVPGSFYGRLFPESSLHFAYSSMSLLCLFKMPEGLLDKNSPSWNKGRIHYVNSRDEVVNAYAAQFAKGMEIFLDARAKEIVAGGMVVLMTPAKPDGVPVSQILWGIGSTCLESSLLDMAKEGLISEALVDSFNVPTYVPSLQEMSELVAKNGCFSIEKMELTRPELQATKTNTHSIGQAFAMSARAGSEGTISQHFGSEIIEELFSRFGKKADQQVSDWKFDNLLMILKRI